MSPGAEGWWPGLWCDSQLESRLGCNQDQRPPKQSVHMHMHMRGVPCVCVCVYTHACTCMHTL